MQMSPEGRKQLIEAFEGLRLTAYRDPAGIWTIFYGHTSRAGEPLVMQGMMGTAEEADRVLSSDLLSVEIGVNACIKAAVRQREFDAMVDLAYNIGLGNFRSSSVLRFFNQGYKQACADAFLLWHRLHGYVLPSLTRRREAERAWFLGLSPIVPVNDPVHLVDHPDLLRTRVANRIALALKPGA